MLKVNCIVSHAAVAAIAAIAAVTATLGAVGILPSLVTASSAQVQGQRFIEVLTQALPDLNREMRVRVTERDPGNGSAPHRHPGHHTFGYILEGTYELKVGDGPVRHLNPGEAFYEPPGALHAVSRNPSADKRVRYLIFQVADPTKPATVQE